MLTAPPTAQTPIWEKGEVIISSRSTMVSITASESTGMRCAFQ